MLLSSVWYCVLNKQICSLNKLQIGKLKILEIRAQLEKQDGFDLAEFHDRLLSMGSVPLEILEEEMLNQQNV